MSKNTFILHSNYTPSGDQPEAIARLVDGIDNGNSHQTLKGVTGSGKTFTVANIIHRLKRPTIILAHNKTLAAQLYSEMRHFFPENAVEFYVSYYDYYQPEVYLPGSDRFIRKDSAINEHLERLRLSTTKALIERRDVIVVASVSSIYGLGDPDAYRSLQVKLWLGQEIDLDDLIQRLERLQYTRCNRTIKRATFLVREGVIDIFPADSEHQALTVEIEAGRVNQLYWIDAISGQQLETIAEYCVSPKTLYSVSIEQVELACGQIMNDMEQQVAILNADNRLTEAARLYERTVSDLELLQLQGYCPGIENYASYLNQRDPQLPPTTLFDYLPKDGLLFIDESHVMIPQISAMHKSDQSRKNTLIDFGFRLPSARNNRPLSFTEFESIKPQTIFVSATPSNYELTKSKQQVFKQIIRPTGLLDPEIEIRPSDNNLEDLVQEIALRVSGNERTLVTTLTKKSAESLNDFLSAKGFKVSYLHSDIKTNDRVEIIKALRVGEIDVLIGINLLREGLDIPEASLVAVLDADKAGFLRSEQALIQIIGRAARNENGKAILYADKVTTAMQSAIDESAERRGHQIIYNMANGVVPSSSKRRLDSGSQTQVAVSHMDRAQFCESLSALCQQITAKEKELLLCVDEGGADQAKVIREQLIALYRQFIFM
ncbi:MULTISPECIES: excinuclease ABC subunit UvrB [unclassified Shewanella]|uniref:excinuclease ABC subunit UvrB n=1 Tax=unclassified Shewanella TaxID=196818 RepID=UPI001BC2C2D0|nr:MULTISPECIES: excinuclease ABC subunit UvrB [unclassified Shewanella]GIU15877.1 UvrABC system protein B [Shewanella sp. MBTL60-112-B1]GIU39502.1 UvrABC system protein B [Shewanella sp. MBTL60-112-B2]